MRINRWFEEKEFYCRDKDNTPPPYIDYNLVAVLTDVREHFGVAVHITSSYRTPEYNRAIGGVSSSHHLYLNNGAAADIQVKGIDPDEVYEYVTDKYPNTLGVGAYNTFTHIDVRVVKARWDNRSI